MYLYIVFWAFSWQCEWITLSEQVHLRFQSPAQGHFDSTHGCCREIHQKSQWYFIFFAFFMLCYEIVSIHSPFQKIAPQSFCAWECIWIGVWACVCVSVCLSIGSTVTVPTSARGLVIMSLIDICLDSHLLAYFCTDWRLDFSSSDNFIKAVMVRQSDWQTETKE